MSHTNENRAYPVNPESGHPFWTKTANDLVIDISAARFLAGNVFAAMRPYDEILKMTPEQLRNETQAGKLPRMYPWDDEVWEGIKMHVARQLEERLK